MFSCQRASVLCHLPADPRVATAAFFRSDSSSDAAPCGCRVAPSLEASLKAGSVEVHAGRLTRCAPWGVPPRWTGFLDEVTLAVKRFLHLFWPFLHLCFLCLFLLLFLTLWRGTLTVEALRSEILAGDFGRSSRR